MKLSLAGIAILIGMIILSGCGGRMGHTPDRAFVSPASLGTHKGLSEGQGMLYTLRGGHIDMAHVRGPADQTKQAYDRAYACIVNGRRSFTVSPAWERITNKVQFEYPARWDAKPLAERQQVARAVALKIAPVVGYNSALYHEILTWKGAKFFLIEPELKSSFSWEDLYSNIMGAWLATEAIKTGGDFNATFTRLLDQELARLQVVPRNKAEQITESVRGKWFTRARLMKKNMDSYQDADVSPCIVPGFTNAEPITYPLPTLQGIERYGINVTYTINSMFLENQELKRIAGTSGPLQPLKDFKPIMKNCQQEGIARGFDVHK
ncbi:MAG: DUF4056 domain-containing protein [Planctomycetaceae bacterium]|nr:DUF4056 domain-containing protein [Planctomycetaceae bacterium]